MAQEAAEGQSSRKAPEGMLSLGLGVLEYLVVAVRENRRARPDRALVLFAYLSLLAVHWRRRGAWTGSTVISQGLLARRAGVSRQAACGIERHLVRLRLLIAHVDRGHSRRIEPTALLLGLTACREQDSPALGGLSAQPDNSCQPSLTTPVSPALQQLSVQPDTGRKREGKKQGRRKEAAAANGHAKTSWSSVPVEVPTDVPSETWSAWMRQAEEFVQGSCPRIARVAPDLLLNGLRQGLRQLLPPAPLPDERMDHNDRQLAADARRKAKPTAMLLEWLCDVESRSGEGRRGVKWIETVLRGGPDPASFLAPGFGHDAQARQESANA